MTEKQKAFVDEYLRDFNGTQAAIRAGYSEKAANREASRLLSNVDVSRALTEAMEARSQRCKVDADYVLSLLTQTAERCVKGKVSMVFDREEKAMVPATDSEGNVVWEFDSSGANRAAELIGKHLGMFTEKTELSGQINVTGLDEALKRGYGPKSS